MKTLAALTILAALATPAAAQIERAPLPSEQRSAYSGTWQTRPAMPGMPEWGTVTTGPRGQYCTTRPTLPGMPEWGVTTTCN